MRNGEQLRIAMTKKTRELPNVTECHCCHLRVDLAKSNNLLHLLYSEWRVVLLCSKCLERVESTELCSFCFTSSADNDCFSCRNCRRRVHRDCDSQHRTSSVWSSSSAAEDELSVCGDCFVSESLVRWRRSRNSSGYGRKNRFDSEAGKVRVLEDQRKCDSDSSPPVCDAVDEEEKEDDVDEEEVLKEGQGSCSNEVVESESPPLPPCCFSKGENGNAALDPYYFKYRRRRTSSSVDNALLTYKRRSVAEAVERCKGLRRRNFECPLLTYKRRGSFDMRFMFTYKRRKNFDEGMLTYRRRLLDKAES